MDEYVQRTPTKFHSNEHMCETDSQPAPFVLPTTHNATIQEESNNNNMCMYKIHEKHADLKRYGEKQKMKWKTSNTL